MATKENPSASAPSTVSSRFTPPSRMRGMRQGVEELAGVGKEVGLLEGILLEEPRPDHPEPGPERRRQGGGELHPRRLPPEQVHGIGQRAPPGQLEGVEGAVGLEHAGELDALVQPQAAGAHRRPC